MSTGAKWVVAIVACSLVLLIAYRNAIDYGEPTEQVPTEQPMVADLHLGWFLTATFDGELLAADRFAADAGLKLRLVPGGPDVPPENWTT